MNLPNGRKSSKEAFNRRPFQAKTAPAFPGLFFYNQPGGDFLVLYSVKNMSLTL
jgi:hypothetical protein